LANPQAATEQVFLLLDGFRQATRMFGGDTPLDQAKESVRRLIAPST
jgi:hypothetical protein